MTQPDFIVIPTQLLTDEALQPSDRILFGYIYWMTKLALMKCVASNRILSELSGLSERGVQQSLVRLEEQGYVRRIFVGDGSSHRGEIVCLLAFSASKQKTGRTNVRPSTNKRAPSGRTNVRHNKKIEKEKLKREIETNVSIVHSAAPPAPGHVEKSELPIQAKAAQSAGQTGGSINARELLGKLHTATGGAREVLVTPGRLRKLAARLKTFTARELVTAAEALGADGYMQGDNPAGKRWGTLDYLLRSDEVVDKYLSNEVQFTEGAF